MRNLKDYFTETPKAEKSKVRREEEKDEGEEEEVQNKKKSSQKRGRVKIKISRTSREGEVCNILPPNPDDLVDKTPSPATNKVKDKEDDSTSGTPVGTKNTVKRTKPPLDIRISSSSKGSRKSRNDLKQKNSDLEKDMDCRENIKDSESSSSQDMVVETESKSKMRYDCPDSGESLDPGSEPTQRANIDNIGRKIIKKKNMGLREQDFDSNEKNLEGNELEIRKEEEEEEEEEEDIFDVQRTNREKINIKGKRKNESPDNLKKDNKSKKSLRLKRKADTVTSNESEEDSAKSKTLVITKDVRDVSSRKKQPKKVHKEEAKSSTNNKPIDPNDISDYVENSNHLKGIISSIENQNGGIINSQSSNDKNLEQDEPPSIEKTNEENDKSLASNDRNEREESSNAFQVLMTRTKPAIQYVSPPNVSEDRTETRQKAKENKEKLIVLADKKGYSKRKLADMEEGERIEKRIEKRTRFFRKRSLSQEEDSSSNLQRTSSGESVERNSFQRKSGNLLNYFSKSSQESQKNNESVMSVVKSDIRTNKDWEKTQMKVSQKEDEVQSNSNSNDELLAVDEIEMLDSQILSPMEKCETVTDNKLTPGKKKRSTWSLRIKAQPNEDGETEDAVKLPIIGTESDSDLEIFSPRSKKKHRKENPSGHSKKDSPEDSSSKKIDKTVRSSKILSPLPKHETNSKVESNENELEDSDVILIDGNSNSNCEIIKENLPKRKSNEKIAPLFLKKHKPDPQTVAARRLFLQPDVSEGKKKEKKSPPPPQNPILPFPKISHVPQLSSNDLEKKIIDENWKVSFKDEINYHPIINFRHYKNVTNSSIEEETNFRTVKIEPVKIHFEEILSELETQCLDARELWKKISAVPKAEPLKVSPKVSKKRKSSDKKDAAYDRFNDVWTCKYQPMSTSEIVGNEDAAKSLKNWLESWKFSFGSKNNENDSSGDEFYSSDCSYSSNNENNQVAVLLGPHGSGKSASVYAVAEELGYSVLELNASSKRPGKKILKDLEEATKSHRVKNQQNDKKLLLQSMREMKKKIPQNSLILVEDVDLIFDEDEGFVSAIFQLASNTKRPIVMTSRDICPHLSKMAPQQLHISFQKATNSRVSAFLELISVAETGYRLPQRCLQDLLHSGDLRKALLQLQYLLVSRKIPTFNFYSSTDLKNTLWRDMRYNLYKPAIKSYKKAKKYNPEKSNQSENQKIFQNLAHNLENISLITRLTNIEDPTKKILKMEQSLSLVEDTSLYNSLDILGYEISEWISERTFRNYDTNVDNNFTYQNTKKDLYNKVNSILSQVSSTVSTDKRSNSTDYLPYIRTICRAEEIRSSSNSKRGNRFFHYLNGLKLPLNLTKPNILSAACKMMQEKETKESN